MRSALPLVLLAAAAGCKEAPTRSEAVGVATTHAAVLDRVETVDVPTDRAAVFVLGRDRAERPIVVLHGACADAATELERWATTTSLHGTVIALEGHAPCANGTGRSWHVDPSALDRRIDAAIEAVRTVRGVALDPRELVLVGEGAGATRATALAAKMPAKYTRLVLVAAPDGAEAPTATLVRMSQAEPRALADALATF